MPNDLTVNPLIVDTASGVLLTIKLTINKIRWVNGTAAGHTALVQDQNGKRKWEAVATGSNYTEETHFSEQFPLIVDGLKVPTLGSGTLFLYVSTTNFYGVPIPIETY